jgi:peptidoglycan/xylan/chitin deacetylase (PgdA/CDA1 family)
VTPAGTVVLLYHRVAHLSRDPHGLAVRPDRFAQHCEILRQRCHVVPLSDAKGRPRQVAITFDDGYADNAHEARSILAAAGLPATFFITIGRIGDRAEAWWDRLAQILLECETTSDAIELTIADRRLWLDIRSPSARARAHVALFWRLRVLRPAAIESILAEIEARLGIASVDRESHRWMNTEELRALSASEGTEVGAHTLTHPLLSTLDAEEQWKEIDGSRDQLERLLGRPVRLFSYPHGGHDAFDVLSTQLVRKAGYTMACTATGGIARAGSDPFLIPRNTVGDWDAERFGRWLDHWLRQP